MRWIARLLLAASLLALPAHAVPALTNLWQEFAWPTNVTSSAAIAELQGLIREQNWAQTMTIVENRLFEQPADAGALHIAGLLFWQAGDREEATRRLIRATRAPDAQSISLWALAALSSQARSQAEAVGWIKRARRCCDDAMVEAWLRTPHFSALCEYPPYRELLAAMNLRDLCPMTDIAVPYEGRRDDADAVRDLLERPAPATSLRLPVQESPALRLRSTDDSERPPSAP